MWQQLGRSQGERLVRALLLLVIFLLPLGSVLILSESHALVAGTRNSFAVPVLYLTEFLIVGAAVVWAMVRRVPDRDPEPFLPLLGLVGLAAVTVLWAPWRFLAGIGLVHLFVAFLFVYVLAHEFRDQQFFRKALWAFTAGAALQAVWGLAQFLAQRDFGLWWLGESNLAQTQPGIAKVATADGAQIRAYGSFLHPNVLAAYIATAAFWVGTVVFWNGRGKGAPRRSWLRQTALCVLLALLGAGLLVTFSRTAIVATLVGGSLVALFSWRRWHWLPPAAAVAAVITLAVALVLAPSLMARTKAETRQETGLTNRAVGYEQASKVIVDQPLGVGTGNFVLAARVLDPDRPAYQYQPVHNSPLLLVSELGVLGGVLFGWFVYRTGRRFHRNGSRDRQERSIEFMLFALAGVYALLAMMDHFFWSVPQGLWLGGLLVAAIIARSTPTERRRHG